MFSGGKRRPSFKMVSNMVIQLLHSIKYSVEVPFSNMAQQPVEIQKTVVAKKVNKLCKKMKKKTVWEINASRGVGRRGGEESMGEGLQSFSVVFVIGLFEQQQFGEGS